MKSEFKRSTSISLSNIPTLQQNFLNNKLQSGCLIKLKGDQAVLCKKEPRNTEIKRYGVTWGENFKDNRTKGYLSRKSKRNITDICEVWGITIQELKKEMNRDEWFNKFRLSFITLTLPSEQILTDYEVKRKCLNTLLNHIRRNWNIKQYLWVAEAAKNGRIHFHLVTSGRIDYKELNRVWNEILQKQGFNSINKYKYKNTYAPSTDIQAVREPDKLGYYLTKYLTKGQNTREIYGRLWGCSKVLRNLEMHQEIVQNPLKSELYNTLLTNALEVRQLDYCMVLKFDQNVFLGLKNVLKDGYLRYININNKMVIKEDIDYNMKLRNPDEFIQYALFE
jgi:hypothetical protein